MRSRPLLLVVAGESSGDAMAADVIRGLRVDAFGMGGPALASIGVDTLAGFSRTNAMGLGSVAVRAPAIASSAVRLATRLAERAPRAALLAGYTEFNARLGRRLRRLGTRVLWYGAPQIWAWRPARGVALRHSCDRMAVVLPFEEALWRRLGVDAHYVGHPAVVPLGGPVGSTEPETLALLPGSRPHEVLRTLPPMLGAATLLNERRGAISTVVMAPGLDDATRGRVREAARRHDVQIRGPLRSGEWERFKASIVCSGTATLESAAALVPPVITYRTDSLSAAVARRLLVVDSVGLPNLVLGERAFPERLQNDATADQLAASCEEVLDNRSEYVDHCRRVRDSLGAGKCPPAERVRKLLEPWLV